MCLSPLFYSGILCLGSKSKARRETATKPLALLGNVSLWHKLLPCIRRFRLLGRMPLPAGKWLCRTLVKALPGHAVVSAAAVVSFHNEASFRAPSVLRCESQFSLTWPVLPMVRCVRGALCRTRAHLFGVGRPRNLFVPNGANLAAEHKWIASLVVPLLYRRRTSQHHHEQTFPFDSLFPFCFPMSCSPFVTIHRVLLPLSFLGYPNSMKGDPLLHVRISLYVNSILNKRQLFHRPATATTKQEKSIYILCRWLNSSLTSFFCDLLGKLLRKIIKKETSSIMTWFQWPTICPYGHLIISVQCEWCSPKLCGNWNSKFAITGGKCKVFVNQVKTAKLGEMMAKWVLTGDIPMNPI